MTIDQIRQRARRSKKRERRDQTVRIGAAMLWILSAVASLMLGFPHPLRGWINGIQLLAIVVWFAFSGPQALERPVVMGLQLASNLGATSCLDFYRRELLERRERLRRNFKSVPILAVFAVAFTVFGANYRDLAAFFGSLLIVVLLVLYARLRREYPKIQAELEELDAFSRSQAS
jgi:hypothetical protein